MIYGNADSYVCGFRQWVRDPGRHNVVDLPLVNAPLREVITFGDGKDTDVMIELQDGQRYVFGLAAALRVGGCPGLMIELTRWDDRSVITRYYGQHLVVASAHIGVPDQYPHDQEGFFEEFPDWPSVRSGVVRER